jgi:hypothetical protein
MADQPWTWDGRRHPEVAGVLAAPTADLGWCERLETAAADATVGKVLCVCAAAAVAREVLATCPVSTGQAVAALELLNHWMDEPTDERFDRICSIVFAEAEQPNLDPYGVVWWAIRTATSSVGNYEAGWALKAVCDAATGAGFSPEQLRAVVEQELQCRVRGAE